MSARTTLPWGAWHDPAEFEIGFPPGWHVHSMQPDGAPTELDDAGIARAFAEPVGTAPLRELAAGGRRAVVAVDDLTRPTPVHRILPHLLDELFAAGLQANAIEVLIGTAAHRPMTREEIDRKLGPWIAGRVAVRTHDFMGPEIRFAGHVEGGPVYLDRRFLEADLRIVVGGAIPHNETGFGGGAKMVVPGVAGRLSIAHFHGSLPPRPAGCLEAENGRLDRRAWSEAVARHVGVDAAVCAVVDGRAQLTDLFVGDVVHAHRRAAVGAAELGRTPVPRDLAERADAVLVNAWPLDTDPIQMGKSLTLADKLPPTASGRPRLVIAVNAASDGIFYHGMGMGSGFHARRLLRNAPRWLAQPAGWAAFARGLARALPTPTLVARTCYFHLNQLAWAEFAAGEGRRAIDEGASGPDPAQASPLLFSHHFPRWGFSRRYPRGRLFREWSALNEALASRAHSGEVLVFPCAPLQLIDIV